MSQVSVQEVAPLFHRGRHLACQVGRVVKEGVAEAGPLVRSELSSVRSGELPQVWYGSRVWLLVVANTRTSASSGGIGVAHTNGLGHQQWMCR